MTLHNFPDPERRRDLDEKARRLGEQIQQCHDDTVYRAQVSAIATQLLHMSPHKRDRVSIEALATERGLELTPFQLPLLIIEVNCLVREMLNQETRPQFLN